MMGATESSSGEGSISDIEGGVQNVSIRGEEGGPVPTSQLQPLSGTQVKNSAGGYVWKADDMTRLRRFLCLGTDKGTYYIGEQELTMENANCVIEMLENGWGRHHRTAVKDWYLDKEPYEVALAVTKYKSRNGWSHRDLLRLTHPRVSGEMDDIFCYVVKGWDSLCEKRLKRQSEDQEAMDTGKRKKGII